MGWKVIISPSAQGDLEDVVRYSIYRIKAERSFIAIVRFWHAARGFPQIPSD